MPDILELARECGAEVKSGGHRADGSLYYPPMVIAMHDALRDLERRIREDERQRCASEVDGAAKRINSLMLTDSGSQVSTLVLASHVAVCQELAAAIRRGGDHG